MGDILFLAHRVPFPPNRGDKIRSHHLLGALARLGRVHVGCFAESEEDRASQSELEKIAATHCVVDRSKPLVLAGLEAVLSGKPVSLTAFHSQRLAQWVRETIKHKPIGTIVVFSGQMGQFMPQNFDGRVIVDLCDVDSAKFEGYAASGRRVWLNQREGTLLAQEEERLASRADATILISRNEAELFRSRLKKPCNAHVQVIGNGIDAGFFDPKGVAALPEITGRPGPHFVFTGQMDYAPNETAALWAIRAFLPAIRAHYPNAEVHIVGRAPTPALLDAGAVEGAYVWGEVDDVRPFLAAATCVVAPLQIARGVQNKVLEAMAMAKPVLLTPEAATGIDARDAEHWLVCDADADGRAMARRFAGDAATSEQRTAIGEAARQFVCKYHDWEATLAPLSQLIAGSSHGARNAA